MEEGIRRQILIACIVYIGQLQVGFGLGWTAPVIPKLQDPDATPLPDVITDGQSSWVGSLLYVGTITGPHITGYLSNIIGRKPCLMLGSFLTLMSFVLVVLARNLAMVFTVRIVNGLGVGIIAVSNIVYLGELASTHVRGILMTCTAIFSTVGTLIIYSIGPYVSFAATGYIGGSMTAVSMICLLFIPESPVYNVMKGKEDEAKATLESLGRGKEFEATIKMESADEHAESKLSIWSEIFTEKNNLRAFFITLPLLCLQQMSGVIVVTFFATRIFEMAGSSIQPNIATIIIGVSQIFASINTPFFVERAGRKTLLLLSTSVCCLSLAVLGTYFYLDEIGHTAVNKIGWIPLVTLIVFFISYDFGFGIIPNTFTGEMFSDKVRSSGSALVVTLAWIVGFGLASSFGYMVASFGPHVTFWIFSGSCAIAFVFTLVFVPETKGKSLFEIQKMLSKGWF